MVKRSSKYRLLPICTGWVIFVLIMLQWVQYDPTTLGPFRHCTKVITLRSISTKKTTLSRSGRIIPIISTAIVIAIDIFNFLFTHDLTRSTQSWYLIHDQAWSTQSWYWRMRTFLEKLQIPRRVEDSVILNHVTSGILARLTCFLY